MSPTNQIILGYQIRISINSVSSHWSTERRTQYLINQNIVSPLSADITVWPLLDNPDEMERFFKDFTRGEFSNPNGLGIYQLYEYDITAISFLEDRKGILIGIGAEKNIAEHLRNMHSIDTQDGVLIGKFLGFDVCDHWLTSGLSNCGVGKTQHSILQDKFGDKINCYGLFEQYNDAIRYSVAIGEMVCEHAPFFPISIFISI